MEWEQEQEQVPVVWLLVWGCLELAAMEGWVR